MHSNYIDAAAHDPVLVFATFMRSSAHESKVQGLLQVRRASGGPPDQHCTVLRHARDAEPANQGASWELDALGTELGNVAARVVFRRGNTGMPGTSASHIWYAILNC